MQSILSVSQVSKTYASGQRALEHVDLEIRKRRDLRTARPQRRGQDHADQHHLRHRHAELGDDPRRRSRRDPPPPRGALADRAGAAGNRSRHVLHRRLDDALLARAVRQEARSGASRSGAQGPVAMGQARREDHGAVGRHEAPRDDRQGAQPRARHPVPRRAHRGRRRVAAPRHVEDDREIARARHDDHPDHALYRGGRGDGRPGGRDQQGAAAAGRGEGRADEEARQARDGHRAGRADDGGSGGAGGMASQPRGRGAPAALHVRRAGRTHRHSLAAAQARRAWGSASRISTRSKSSLEDIFVDLVEAKHASNEGAVA